MIRGKIFSIFLFFSSTLAAFPSISSMKQEILLLAAALKKARQFYRTLPDRKTLKDILSGKRRPPFRHGFLSKGRLILLRPRKFYAVFESADAMALSDRQFILTLQRNSGKCTISLTCGGLRWIGEYRSSGRELLSVPLAEELIIRKNRITRSRRKKEYLISVTDMYGYGYRFSKNGILSFNKLTTPSLFTEMNWLQNRGRTLLKAASEDVPGNIVSRILSSRMAKRGHLGNIGDLTCFTINYFRKKAGLPTVSGSGELKRAASGHAAYIAANIRSGRTRAPHTQFRDGFGYTGKNVSSRIKSAGYKGRALELIGYEGNPVSSIAEWMGTIHHRRSILAAKIRDCGFASTPFAYSDSSGVAVLLLGIGSAAGSAPPMIWTGCSPIWPSWDGREHPQTLNFRKGPFGPVFSFHSRSSAGLWFRGRRIRSITIRISREEHLIPSVPLSWGTHLVLKYKNRHHNLKTIPYPPSLRLLDRLHAGCKKM